MKKLKIHVTFTEGILGTATADPEIYSRFIGSKSPDAATLPEEVAALGEDAIIERGTTVFPKDEDGTLFLWDYQIKGFFKDACGMLSRLSGKDPETGKEYETERAEICEEGFHACEFPLDVLWYYNPADSRFCEVELDANEQTHDDSKRVGKKIKIDAEIGLSGLVKAGVKFILEKADFENAKATNTGDCSAATNTGDCSAATVEGKESIAIVTGNGSKASGKRGCWLVLTERDNKNHVLGVQAVKVDGKTIKEDAFYTLSGGKVTEVK